MASALKRGCRFIVITFFLLLALAAGAAFSSAAMTALRDCLVRWFATRSPWRTGHDTLAPPLSSCASAP